MNGCGSLRSIYSQVKRSSAVGKLLCLIFMKGDGSLAIKMTMFLLFRNVVWDWEVNCKRMMLGGYCKLVEASVPLRIHPTSPPILQRTYVKRQY